MKKWLNKISLALIMLLTVYNFFIIDNPNKIVTGAIFVILIHFVALRELEN